MRPQLSELFFLSSLEKGRIAEPVADPRKVAVFEDLTDFIMSSVNPPRASAVDGALQNNASAALRAAARNGFSGDGRSLSAKEREDLSSALNHVARTKLRNPEFSKRPFEDEALLEKLIQYRNQMPVSNRIIRSGRS